MTTYQERRFDRGSWLTLGFVLLLIVASATVSLLCFLQVGDGCLFDAGQVDAQVVGACVGDWATPLRPGDAWLGIAGIPSPPDTVLNPQHMPPGWIDGGSVHYTVRRGGHTLELRVPLHRLGAAGILRAFGYGVQRQALDWNTPVCLGMLLVFLLAPRARAAQLLLAALGGLTAVTTLLWPSSSVAATFVPTPLWYSDAFLLDVWMWWFIPTLLLVVLTFPRRVWPLTRRPRLAVGLIYGLPVILVMLGIGTANGSLLLGVLGGGALVVVGALATVTLHTFMRVRDAMIRAQTAWLGLGLAAGLLFWPLVYVLALLVPGLLPAINRLPWWASLLVNWAPTLAFPVCLGIAITRYRLFDIDVIINRTLVYGSLTAALALVYVGSVVVLQQLVRALTGQGQNQVAVVVSTLAIAALFQPLRRRIQTSIDRRFYRRKYDAARTLQAFGTRLRNEVDFEVLTADLLAVVDETLQPTHVSLWLHDGSPRVREQSGDAG